MQRPVMNPNLFEDAASPARQKRRPIKALFLMLWQLLRFTARAIFYDPFHSMRGFRVEEGTPTSRLARNIFYRLAFVPVFLAAAASAIVWTSTHPRTVTGEMDPSANGVYFEAVTFASSDNVSIEGWLAPVLNAKTVLAEKEKVLRKRHPAVVLVHDIGQRRDQMLPLIKPLHDAGYVVLAINLRGGGLRPAKGATFGLNESNDVKAAIDLLRRRTFVDPTRVGVVGAGTGATACLLAANADPSIAAIAVEQPIRSTRELVEEHLIPQNYWVKWLAPLCKWSFEIAYGLDAEEVDSAKFKSLFERGHVLVIDHTNQYKDVSDPDTSRQIAAFLDGQLKVSESVAALK